MLFGDSLIADRNGKEYDGGKNMPVLDSAIAYYLCGIMIVLGVIIVIGVTRQHLNKDKQ
jgi:hypothetical protein